MPRHQHAGAAGMAALQGSSSMPTAERGPLKRAVEVLGEALWPRLTDVIPLDLAAILNFRPQSRERVAANMPHMPHMPHMPNGLLPC